ncbi:SAF domain-containing protein [Jatrophihabitans endophyticus]|uniref:SAF domain-containing protein n=1 Tax=Jatrophihabitans endophyticus TaxID=1206085 RepID=UPI0019F4A3C1|nr:SAF domain-containing protein [Jatrophihabitans endophyticus]MBE7187831.1 flagella basal body P-ring formation protein FlgA [Jatrophihabitans endophyticus]
MVATSPSPRRITTPRWFDLRLVLGVVLVLAAVALGAALFSRAGDTAPVVTATHDLEVGTVLRPDDLTISRVRLPSGSGDVYLDHVEDAVGKRLGRAVSQGELLPSAALVTAGRRTTITVPLSSGAAPDLRDGERIEIWLSTARCASVVLLDDVTVQDVRTDAGGSFEDGAQGQDVVISVPPALAGRVVAAQAITDAKIRAGVLTGGGDPTTDSTLPPAGSATGGGLPSDLADCAPSDR